MFSTALDSCKQDSLGVKYIFKKEKIKFQKIHDFKQFLTFFHLCLISQRYMQVKPSRLLCVLCLDLQSCAQMAILYAGWRHLVRWRDLAFLYSESDARVECRHTNLFAYLCYALSTDLRNRSMALRHLWIYTHKLTSPPICDTLFSQLDHLSCILLCDPSQKNKGKV